MYTANAALEPIDQSHQLIASGDFGPGMELLVSSLRASKRDMTHEEWNQFVTDAVLPHPIREVIHRCPFTRHAYVKPRGYPGDAQLLDHIYGRVHEALKPKDPIAQGIYQYTTNAPAPRAVRYRRQFIADLVNTTMVGTAPRRILSVASGHLREAELVDLQGAALEWVALDQDAESLRTVATDYAHLGVRTLHQNIRSFLVGRADYGKFDLIYAAGLFDYLADDVALRLMQSMVDATAPGGRIMIANFTPDIPDLGYMESFMAWQLIYRSTEDLRRLVDTLAAPSITGVKYSTDPDQNIAFAVLQKRAEIEGFRVY